MDLMFRCPRYLIVNVGDYGRRGGCRKVRARAAANGYNIPAALSCRIANDLP